MIVGYGFGVVRYMVLARHAYFLFSRLFPRVFDSISAIT